MPTGALSPVSLRTASLGGEVTTLPRLPPPPPPPAEPTKAAAPPLPDTAGVAASSGLRDMSSSSAPLAGSARLPPAADGPAAGPSPSAPERWSAPG